VRFIKNEDRQRMSISKTKLNYLSALASVTCITAALGALVFYFLLPEHYFNWYPFIPIYFFVLGVFSIYMFDACRKHMPKKLVLFHLALKIIRMIFSVFILVLYCLAVKDYIREFMVTFIIFYLVNLVFESWFFLAFECNRKRKKENEKIA
jgi:small-conductance mechanosensitive channel